MKETALQVGDVVQLSPENSKNPMFGGCFMTVTELKTWGAIGYVQALGAHGQPGGLAFYRAEWETMERIGRAEWVMDRGDAQADAGQAMDPTGVDLEESERSDHDAAP